jgi:hypothetical protein
MLASFSLETSRACLATSQRKYAGYAFAIRICSRRTWLATSKMRNARFPSRICRPVRDNAMRCVQELVQKHVKHDQPPCAGTMRPMSLRRKKGREGSDKLQHSCSQERQGRSVRAGKDGHDVVVSMQGVWRCRNLRWLCLLAPREARAVQQQRISATSLPSF